MNHILCGCPLFYGIGEKDLERMLGCLSARKETFAPRQMIYVNGDTIEEVGIITEGEVQIVRDDFEGRRSILAHIGPGGVFGEAYGCLPGMEIPVSVECVRECSVLFLNYHKVLTTCDASCVFHQKLIENMAALLASKNVQLNQKLECLEKRTTREKLLAYVNQEKQRQRSSKIKLPFSKKDLADYLCVDRSGMMVELKKLQTEGILTVEKSWITIGDEVYEDQ
ncbi:Crp/Fnr family transcriptional regulator [Anaerostipes sp.]|uniref:Crp/Fnr family transcriptional regulator n=1 Tax=Anaerostipes sp. TaxID=1872530 RepID=UPI0025B93536|nr:Crp/Fnr family transcriptional regulator [Anaerostipes sp.]MBS7006972.1 Crp/Fnr family transcriptional regulator [Anaerostipes sp.]